MLSSNYLLVGRIRSPSDDQAAGDIVIKKVVIDGVETRKIFQRDAQWMPVRQIYRAIDRWVGNENIGSSLDEMHKNNPGLAMNRLHSLSEHLKNVREKLEAGNSAKPEMFLNLSENLDYMGDLPGNFSARFKLSERFDTKTFFNELKACNTDFSGETLLWLKHCHQHADGEFSNAACERVGSLWRELSAKVDDQYSGSARHHRMLRELDDLKLRMEQRSIGAPVEKMKTQLKKAFQGMDQRGLVHPRVRDVLVEVLKYPDLPIPRSLWADLGFSLSHIDARWDDYSKYFKEFGSGFIAEFSASIQRIEQACATDPVLAEGLKNEMLGQHQLKKLLGKCAELEKALIKNGR